MMVTDGLKLVNSTAFAVLIALAVPNAQATTIGFEGVSDGTSVGSYYMTAGATFQNATVITSGLSLNEIEFPPHSGLNVVADDGGPIRIVFSKPLSSVAGYFTYAEALQLMAFDSSNILIGSAMSLYSANYTSSGEPPNELISLTSLVGISSITINGDANGGSFVLDDLSFTTSAAPPSITVTPEPRSLTLLATGLVAAAGAGRRRWFAVMTRLHKGF